MSALSVPFSSPSVALGAACAVLAYSLVKHWSQRRFRLPPGPRGIPILGNVFDIPSRDEWKAYQTWGAELGSDIISLNMAGTPMIVLNSREVARDLLEKRSAIYSDRPRYVMLNELCGFGWDFNFQPYGTAWKNRRKLFTREMQPPKSLQHRPRVQAAVRSMLQKLARKPDAFTSHLRHMAGEIILSIAYGIEVLAENDPHVQMSEAGLIAIVKAANWGSHSVDFIPWLKHLPEWLPGMGFKKEAVRWKRLSEAMVNKPFEYAENILRRGEYSTSIASSVLENMNEKDVEARTVLRDTLGAMYEAGADTTVSALSTFILAMVLYPEVQRRGREEIEQVIGVSRLPTFEDDKSIPYVDAIVKEVLRWQPVTPLALPHRLESDDEYKGAMLQDKGMYGEDTDAFRPERFLKDGALAQVKMSPGHLCGSPSHPYYYASKYPRL
ncbi:hypothetical protein D9619_008116 [Psilocybe cf. subviscida]|uniref:Cytochrome P450 n=1 Tax=Psilocybe cf. subviscida TaxID=2480587 RepID=A0A8H5AT96_9AGAR|nr:hypothetical protein D9619_008116 [Psilocybe cf. subviscida]